MRCISWNVNGLRAALKKGAGDYLASCAADVICLQEVRVLPTQLDFDLAGYHAIWNPAEKKGYSGTLMLSRLPFLATWNGMGLPEHDREGRVITLRLPDCHLVTVYTPNSQNELRRLNYRMEWDQAFLRYLRRLEKTAPVIVCGDLNVSHQEIDLARPQANRRNAGFTDEERGAVDRLITAGFVDTFRIFEAGGGHYSWWSQRSGARGRNIGWRLDYFFVSATLRERVTAAAIQPEVMGSDHCPVTLEVS